MGGVKINPSRGGLGVNHCPLAGAIEKRKVRVYNVVGLSAFLALDQHADEDADH